MQAEKQRDSISRSSTNPFGRKTEVHMPKWRNLADARDLFDVRDFERASTSIEHQKSLDLESYGFDSRLGHHNLP